MSGQSGFDQGFICGGKRFVVQFERLPYSIIDTRESSGGILIVSIFYQSREPLSWKRNL